MIVFICPLPNHADNSSIDAAHIAKPQPTSCLENAKAYSLTDVPAAHPPDTLKRPFAGL